MLKRVVSSALAAAALLASVSVPAAAQSRLRGGCGERGQIVDHLREAFGQRPAFWMTQGHIIMEVFVSWETFTWTMVSSDTRGNSCVVASGTDFRPAPLDRGPAQDRPS